MPAPKPGHTSTVASKSHLRIKHRGTTRRCQGNRSLFNYRLRSSTGENVAKNAPTNTIVTTSPQGYIEGVGSKTFDGVWFMAYTKDHLPPHVHAFYAGV
jgi:hypothetical protein